MIAPLLASAALALGGPVLATPTLSPYRARQLVLSAEGVGSWPNVPGTHVGGCVNVAPNIVRCRVHGHNYSLGYCRWHDRVSVQFAPGGLAYRIRLGDLYCRD